MNVRTAAEFTGLSGSTINWLHYPSDPSIRSFYRVLFDRIVQHGADTLDHIPELISESARALYISAKNTPNQSNQIVSNVVATISPNRRDYTISAHDASHYFLNEAIALLTEGLDEIISEMRNDVLVELDKLPTLPVEAEAFIWNIDDDETPNDWFEPTEEDNDAVNP